MSPGIPSGFPVTQVFSEEGSEFDTPFAQGLVTDHYGALVEQFLNIPIAQGESVVQPDLVLDDGHWEAMAVGFRVSHSKSAYLDPG